MQKTLSALALAGTIALLGAGAAQAAEYPAPAVAVVVSNGTPAPGEAVLFGGSGFNSNEEILIEISFVPASGSASVGYAATAENISDTIEADENGEFAIEFTFQEAGTYTITAEGLESGVTASATVVVAAAVDGSTPTPGPTAPGGTTPVSNTPGGTTPVSNTPGGTTPVGNNNTGTGNTVVVTPGTVVVTPGTTTGGTTAGNTGTNVAAGTTTATKGGLANTGVETSMVLWGAAGIGALGLGAGSIVVARRRAGAEG